MNKKGMEQVFVYIFILIVAAIVITIGFRAIATIREKQSQVELISFYNELEKQARRFYNADYYSSDEFIFNLPSFIKKVCFTAEGSLLPQEMSILERDLKVIINNRHTGRDRKNVFIYPIPEKAEQSYIFIENLKTETNPLCIDSKNSKLKIILENKGDVYVSSP